MPVKFAVVGTGWVAGEYLKAIHSLPESEVYSIVSGDTVRAKARLDEYGIEARIAASFEDTVRDPQVDAVVLCSTPDVRPQQAVVAAQHGKHLILEKPLSLNLEGLETMAEAIAKYPVRTIASFVLRWNAMFSDVKALIGDDAIGRIHMAQIDYWNDIGPQFGQHRWSSKKRLGGSSILSAGCHAVDALRYFAGDVAEVIAFSARTYEHSDYEFDPNVIAIFKLKNGGIGKVSSSIECRTPYKFHVHLLGEKGAILNNRLYSHKLPGQTDYATIPTIMPDSGDVAQAPFLQEVNEFVRAIRTGAEVRCDFFDAYRTMKVCFAIDESAAAGGKLILQ